CGSTRRTRPTGRRWGRPWPRPGSPPRCGRCPDPGPAPLRRTGSPGAAGWPASRSRSVIRRRPPRRTSGRSRRRRSGREAGADPVGKLARGNRRCCPRHAVPAVYGVRVVRRQATWLRLMSVPPRFGRAVKGTKLVVVESPAKAKTISGYLGPGWVVEASLGHIRDLPAGAKQMPEKYKKEPWAYLGVNVDADFEPVYIVNPDRTKHGTKLRQLLKDAGELYLATDEDREGEAIAWHLVETLKPKVPVRRMVVHEITKPATQAAVANPREINRDLVDAQETRRILDRLYGYDVSQVLWKKVQRGLSAGRVQSVATRIVVERERARMAFRSAEYWDVTATLAVTPEEATSEGPRSFTATLVALDGDRIATGKDFEPTTGELKRGVDAVHLDGDGARGLAARLEGRPFTVTRVETKPYRRKPYPPFITSTLQQEAARKLRMSSAVTMRAAQRLYENGYITYMRTDSVNLSETAIAAARAQIADLYGERFVPPQPRHYTRKVKNAQEAHEAIRPAGDTFRTPGEVADELSVEELKLYELIWRRTIASQMTDAVGSSVSVRIRAVSSSGEECDFAATGKTITDPGFLKAYVESSDDSEAEAEDAERRLPTLVKDQPLVA